MKSVQTEESTILTQRRPIPIRWVEGCPFTVPVKRRLGIAERATREWKRYIELVLGGLRHHGLAGSTGLWRPRRNGRLRHEGLEWVPSLDLPGSDGAPLQLLLGLADPTKIEK